MLFIKFASECKEPYVWIKEPECETMYCYTLQNPQTCAGVDETEPMCGCQDGFLLDENDNCIPKESCSCYLMSGNILAIGMEVEEDCEIWYVLCLNTFFFIVYVHYLCLFAHSGLQHILCCVFYLFYFVLCTLCCQFLWLVLFSYYPFGILSRLFNLFDNILHLSLLKNRDV
jgi:hypothetical protein